jgi:hypothetical protein
MGLQMANISLRTSASSQETLFRKHYGSHSEILAKQWKGLRKFNHVLTKKAKGKWGLQIFLGQSLAIPGNVAPSFPFYVSEKQSSPVVSCFNLQARMAGQASVAMGRKDHILEGKEDCVARRAFQEP